MADIPESILNAREAWQIQSVIQDVDSMEELRFLVGRLAAAVDRLEDNLAEFYRRESTGYD